MEISRPRGENACPEEGRGSLPLHFVIICLSLAEGATVQAIVRCKW